MLLTLAQTAGASDLSVGPTSTGEAPVIDGSVGANEWTDAALIEFDLEGAEVRIQLLHFEQVLYVAFEISAGHVSNLPDTRIYIDQLAQSGDQTDDDDLQLYVNPDNGGLRERHGDGGAWTEAEVDGWEAAWVESGTTAWSVEYAIPHDKLVHPLSSVYAPQGRLAFLVYGNLPGSLETWPADADLDVPSTWGSIDVLDWYVPPPEPNQDAEEPSNALSAPLVVPIALAVAALTVGRRFRNE